MTRRNDSRLPALALRYAGAALMAASLAADLLVNGAGKALAAPFTGIGELVAQVAPVPGLGTPVPDSTASPSPSPAQSAAPKPVAKASPKPPQLGSGGPISFGLTGSLSMGDSTQTRTFGDASSGQQTTSSSTATGTGGLLAQIGRRTATTTLSFQFPVGVSLARTSFGQALASYYTPKYGLQYGVQPFSLLGGIPLGTTLRGFGLVLPIHGGDLTLFQGPADAPGDDMLDVVGVRGRTIARGTLIEFGADTSRDTSGGSAGALMLGGARTSGLLSQIFEGSIERTRGIDLAAPSAFAYQYRADYGGNAVYGSFTLRKNSDGFLSFGNGALQADQFADASVRSSFGSDSIFADESFDTSGTGENLLGTQRGNVNYSHLFKKSNATLQFLISNQRRESAFGTDWTGGGSAQVGFQTMNVGAVFGAQFQRTTLSYGAPQALISYSSSLQRQFGNFLATATLQNTRQTGDAPELQSTSALSLTRNVGLTAFTLTDTNVHTISALSDVLQNAPTISVSRRISNALTAAVTYGEQTTRDRLNPAANGRSRIFSFQLAAPFAIGSGVVQGRANSRLPATISGLVTSDVGNEGALSIASTGVGSGVANVAVILDNGQVQRTDLSGRFQFNFVTPGRHTIQIDTSSLPRGITPDQPVVSIAVLGGQNGQVNFEVGSYGGIQGHVMGRDDNGNLVGIPDVILRVDNAGSPATTGPDGLYGFGRLQPGTHVVEVQLASLPATVSIPANMVSQKVQVRNGAITTADFVAGPLGSIAGSVVFDQSLAPAHRGGAFNAYVVAEPGDYAAIADEDGAFILDNLPPGTYSLDVDPETIPSDTGNNAGPQSITVGGSQHVDGVRFVLARKVKAVVFSFNQGGGSGSGVTLTLQEPLLPPGGATPVTVDAGADAAGVTVSAFGQTTALSYDKSRSAWVGMLDVPAHAASGMHSVTADVKGASHSAPSAQLKIDPAVPIATLFATPHNAAPGQYVAVRARFLADVHAGDTIRWLDGQLTKLPRPVSGRVFQFTVKISEHPMRGFLLTKQGEVPITVR